MARHKLTDAFVRTAPAGKYGDGDGLWLFVQQRGTRSWVFIWIRNGRRREMGLGPYGRGTGDVSLAAAREKAAEARAIIGRGGDPMKEMTERQSRSNVTTFGECADDLIDSLEAGWKNDKHRAQWRMTLGDAYCRSLRKVPIAEIDTDAIVRILKPVWLIKPETATRLRGRIEKVFDYAKARGLRDGENPARWKGHLDRLLPKQPTLSRGHHAAMPYGDVPAFMKRLATVDGIGARALEFCVLTAVRSGEAFGARWDEIGLDDAIWTIPAGRMKAGREHIIPLSSAALAVLEKLGVARNDEFVFPGASGKKPLSNMAMIAVMRRMDLGEFTVHGFRSAFRDWAGDQTSFPREVAEAALAHAVGDQTERAYRRGDALDKRRKLMDAWASYLCPVADRVVVLADRRAG